MRDCLFYQAARVVGIESPALFETIVDVRPIAALGSGTSAHLPDAQTCFNDPLRKIGVYYSAANDLRFCAQARIDSNECFGKNIDWTTAIGYCQEHNDNRQSLCSLHLPFDVSTSHA